MNDLEKKCIAAGLKMTDQRRTILKVLADSNDHPSVDDVYNRAKARDTSISIATVYRTLGLLDELKLVIKHDFGGPNARFELKNDDEGHHHHHLIDTATGDVHEFQSEEMLVLIKKIGEEMGYDIVDYDIQLFGHKKA
jgi:Fur family ferric uptake transcriptional regulator